MNFLLVWDVDGTLVDSKGVGKKSMNKAFFELYGIKNALDKIDMSGRLDYTIIKNVLFENKIDIKNCNRFFEKYCDFLKTELANVSSIACPGIVSNMKEISCKRNIFHALGTGNIELGARLKLSVDKLNRYFPIGGFGNEEYERWEIINHAIEKSVLFYDIDFKKENIFVIGDTNKDIFSGKKIGVKTIGVASGNTSFFELEQLKPDYLFENLLSCEKFIEIFS